jgi:glutamate carboxypeptidase
MTALSHQRNRTKNGPEALLNELASWVAIGSGSNNESGLNAMRACLLKAFSQLDAEVEILDCEGAQMTGEIDRFPRYALRICSRHTTGKPILFSGHYDTVYEGDGWSESIGEVDGRQRTKGPGITDMKGGLLVILETLRRWQAGSHGKSVAWEVLLTPDEEIGSTFSIPLLKESAEHCRFGLVYESSLEDGAFVRARMGSAVYTLRVKGRSSHVGRDFSEGRNAILGLATLSAQIAAFSKEDELIVNVGSIRGGGPLNVVPDLAEAQWNVRAWSPEVITAFEERVASLIESFNQIDPYLQATLEGGVVRPPKVVDEQTEALYAQVGRIAEKIGLPVSWRNTGGGSDGSNLAAYGLPNIDNLGVCGGAIHSPDEFLINESLEERVELSLAILEAARVGEIEL